MKCTPCIPTHSRSRLTLDAHPAAAQLQPGVTERDATRWAMKAYRREGADRFFHLPVALFGERSGLPEPWTTESFWPTDRALETGDAVVLDASPI